jgi:hypothetical protein
MNIKKFIAIFMVSLFIFSIPTTMASPQPASKKPYVFLVFGYGVPKDIFNDANYRTYLGITFNTIFDLVKNKNVEAYVIFGGGPTDLFEPYTRTEAAEMKKYFEYLLQRPFLQTYAKKIHLLTEDESLSTLENMLFAKKIIGKKIQGPKKLFIFGEKTREARIKLLSKKIFNKEVKVFSIDFDLSESRYLDAFIRDKENIEIKTGLWALKNPENMKKYHALFAERIKLLRESPPEDRAKILKEFWEKLKNLTSL